MIKKRVRKGIDKYESDHSSVENNGTISKKYKGDVEAKKYWELSTGKQPRRVEVTEYKGVQIINIREFYLKDGENYLPGKKGISLNVDQYKAFIQAVPSINAHLERLGVDIGVPSVQSSEESKSTISASEEECASKKKKVQKANIETTSDENEEDES